ncbi:MAG: SdpI family protein [Lachnospiraceae bacterium]|nr:SdpI family protein [Lachnospiraceae bacterium]
MKKIDKKTLILSSIVTLIPLVIGCILWEQLPDVIPTHFGMDGTPNGWSSKAFTVFGIPVLMTFFHLLCVGITSQDPKYYNMSDKLFGLIVWLIPVISLLVVVSCYGGALGWNINISKYAVAGSGILFVIIGNYLPKCKQNYTMGIKLPWTLDNEENWNKTHRLAGFIWVVGGLLITLNAFIGYEWLFIVIILIMTMVPVVYSYLYFKNHQ